MITGAEEIALVWFHLVILLSLFPTVFTVHSYLLKTTTTRLPLSLYLNLANEKVESFSTTDSRYRQDLSAKV